MSRGKVAVVGVKVEDFRRFLEALVIHLCTVELSSPWILLSMPSSLMFPVKWPSSLEEELESDS